MGLDGGVAHDDLGVAKDATLAPLRQQTIGNRRPSGEANRGLGARSLGRPGRCHTPTDLTTDARPTPPRDRWMDSGVVDP